MEHEPESRQDATDRNLVALSTVTLERLLVRLSGILQPPLLLNGLCQAFEQRRAHRIARRCKLESNDKMMLGLLDVE